VFKKIAGLFLRVMIYLIIAGLIIFGMPRLVLILATSRSIYKVENAPAAPIAVVFGAGLQRDGTPSPVLRDRVETAAALFFAGKVQKILMSGDNRFIYYNEPGSMQNYALSLGVPQDAIVLDYAGRRTYDTCYRAKEIFGAREVLLVTQNFHLARALFTCQLLGLNASGVSADRRSYLLSSSLSWEIRELPASIEAMWDVWIAHPVPVLGDKEPIFPEDDFRN
jgi:SanA protein